VCATLGVGVVAMSKIVSSLSTEGHDLTALYFNPVSHAQGMRRNYSSMFALFTRQSS